MEWTPLEDKWDELCRFLEEAAIEGLLQDAELADKYAWPQDLVLSQSDREQIGQWTTDRVHELFEVFGQEEVVSPKAIGIYLMNGLLTGMAWQLDRIGR